VILDNVSSFPPVYTDEWLQRIVDGLGLTKRSKDEYFGSCPNCGGDDRFVVKSYNGEVKLFCGLTGRNGCNDLQGIQNALREMGLWPERTSGPLKLPERIISASDLDDPYYMRKNIELMGGAKLVNDVVEVPLFRADKSKVEPQRIFKDGSKKFALGFKKDGAFGCTAKFGEGKTYITEGYATACSVTMATGIPCIFALDAGNLPKVVKAIQKEFPKVQLIGAGDNDPAGIKAMTEAVIPYAVPIYEKADWNDVHVTLGLEAVKTGLLKQKKPLFRRLGTGEIVPPDYLIKPLMERAAFVLVYGPSGKGKSFIVYDMAACVATGKDWHGYKVKQGSVLIIYGEGGSGIDRRLAGWSIKNKESLDDAPLFGNERPLILTNDKDIEALIAYIEHRIEIDGAPALIVVDTLARALGGADERVGSDLNKLITALSEIIAQYDCTILLVHHTGHSAAAQNRARGASELPAAVDQEFRVEPYDEAGIITGTLFTPTKNKDGKLLDALVFDMFEVGLGVMDEDLVELKTLVPELRGPARDPDADKQKPESIVVSEEYKLRTANKLTKKALIDAVRVEAGCSKRTAERWIKRAVEDGKIDV